MINVRKHSIKVDPAKPNRYTHERPKRKHFYLNIVSKMFLPITQVFQDFLTKVSTLSSVSFLLRTGIDLGLIKIF